MQVVILAGGLGTRLGPAFADKPKALAPLLGRPFLEHQLALLVRNGLAKVLLLIGHKGRQIEEQFQDGRRHGVSLRYRYDGDRLLGTGGALRAALPDLDDEFLVLYGDSYLDLDYQAVIQAFRASGKPALMTVYRNQGRYDTSNVVFKNGRLEKYSKRDRTPDMEFIDYGLSAFERDVLLELREGEASDLADLMTSLVARGLMTGLEVTKRFYEIGTPASLAECEEYLRARG
jgi:NDP-sugar pyrophosphorylase family protein